MTDAIPQWIDAIVARVATTADKNSIIRVNVSLVFPHGSNEELTRSLISSQAATILVSFKPAPGKADKGRDPAHSRDRAPMLNFETGDDGTHAEIGKRG